MKRLDGAGTWKYALILTIAGLAIVFSILAALQGKTFDGAYRQGDRLYVTGPDGAPAVVLALRRPDQAVPFRLERSDIVAQVDGAETYAAFDRYIQRQGQLVETLSGRSVRVTSVVAGTSVELEKAVTGLKLSGFSYSFWVSLLVGVTAFLIGGWVWALKPGDVTTRTLAVNGFGMLLAAASSGPLYAWPVALSPQMIVASTALNHLATVIFGMTLIGLFLQFPQRLVSRRQFWLCMATGIPVFVLDQLRLLGGPIGILAYCFIVIALVIILIGVQFYLSRASPGARAALIWLGLAVMAGGGSWGVIVMAYLVQGQFHNMPESLTFLSFLLLYGGVALGVARFRLFEVGDWAFRIFFFVVAAGLFIGLDAGLVYLVGLAKPSAVALSLLLIAFVYLPVREKLWRHFVRVSALNESERLAGALDMAFTIEPAERQARWHALLHTLFSPMSIEILAADVAQTRLEAEGLHMCVPGLNHMPPLRLSYPHSGRGLFSPRDTRLVDQLIRLSAEAAMGLQAYERGAAEQRQRLAQDLHDDVGAKLVSGLTVADDRVRPYIYGALNDIREIATALVTEGAPLDRVLADIRHETARRLDVAGIELDWPLWPEEAPYLLLSARQKKGLTSTVRELVTNIIKHARATQVTVRIALDASGVTGEVGNNGQAFPEAVTDGIWNGHGLKNISDRLGQLNGEVRFRNRAEGVVTTFRFPLQSPVLTMEKPR
ncbi:ATP-binding protein [Asticcacaulis sp. 201]|uniref:sensor histidine kinase n=1 Tax=Asticcacaulis sp. 201 TaxID=3028787 RepID=UPI0029170A0C|nr:ATP-binding protein [Asticcacaulis sp. 201]MDV6329967.1 histidine kinase [Asticcacaulis sp. 201]